MLDTIQNILTLELPFELVTHAGSGEYWRDPITVEEIAPFACYCMLALVVLVQFFIPPLRRLYAGCFRFALGLFGLKAKLAESARLLADALSRFLFTGGLCSFPLAIMLYEDTFHPSLSGPFNFGMAIVGLFFTLVLIAAAFIVFVIWALGRWQKLHRVEKTNPLAAAVAKQRSHEA